MIHIENLYKSFGKNKVLEGIDLSISEKGIFAILGPNGSGKTTLIKSILGMVIPDNGTISINGNSIKNKWNYRNEIDYLPQIANFPANLTVQELIKMIKDLRNLRGDDQQLIDLFKLSPFLNKKLSNLSGGTKQKVNLFNSSGKSKRENNIDHFSHNELCGRNGRPDCISPRGQSIF